MSIDNVGARIKLLRKEQKLTLKDLSEKADISISFLSDIENSRSKPSLERLNNISIALGTTVSYLMDKNENIKEEPCAIKVELSEKEVAIISLLLSTCKVIMGDCNKDEVNQLLNKLNKKGS